MMFNDTCTTPTISNLPLFQATANLGALFAGLIMGVVSDKIGRKPSMLVSCLPPVLGWWFIAGSYYFTDQQTWFYTLFTAGRFLCGFGMGSFSLVVSVCGLKYCMYADGNFC